MKAPTPQHPAEQVRQLKRALMAARTKLQRHLSNTAIAFMHGSGRQISAGDEDAARIDALKKEAGFFEQTVSSIAAVQGAPSRDVLLSTPSVINKIIRIYEKQVAADRASMPPDTDAQDPRYVSADIPTGDAEVSFQRKRGLQLFQTSEPANGMPQFGRGSLFPKMSPQTEQAEMGMPEVEADGIVMPPQVVPASDAAELRIQRLEAQVEKLTRMVGTLVSAGHGRR